MARINWVHIVLVVILALVVLFAFRMHRAAGQAAGQTIAQGQNGNAASGHLSVQAWCTECHSVEPETAGVGKFAPDFTVIAKRRSARWLKSFLRAKHVRMPDFVLNPSEADDIVAYITSLKRS